MARDAPQTGDRIHVLSEMPPLDEDDRVDILAMEDEILLAEARAGVEAADGDVDWGEDDEAEGDAYASERSESPAETAQSVEERADAPSVGAEAAIQTDASPDNEEPAKRANRLCRSAQRGEIHNGFLEANEIPPGHTLEKHVGKTEEWLRNRLLEEDLNSASTFTDLATAEQAVARVLRESSDQINDWLDRPMPKRLALGMDVGNVVGRVMTETGSVLPCSMVSVVLQRSAWGYQIVTAFVRKEPDRDS